MRGSSINEATRWINIPGLNVSFQTSDFAKMALMLNLAFLLSKKRDEVNDFKKGFIPFMFPICLTCGLIFPSNFSTAALLFVTSAILLFVGRVRLKYLLALLGTGIAFFGIIILIAVNLPDTGRTGTWKKRVTTFISNEDSFQAEQSKTAISTGGIFGKGVGKSVQRNTLPHSYSDFIFAIIVEEYGSFFALGIVLLYLILLYHGIGVVKKITNTFPALLVAGMTLLIVIQAFAHICVCVGIVPDTGQTLPMVSMGGTSLLITGAQFGMILSVSRAIFPKKSKKEISNDIDNKLNNAQNNEHEN
jgi:cell division protein FtsW